MSERVFLQDVCYVLPGGRVLFEKVSAAFGRGLHGLTGANGVGKSMLLRLAAGVLEPSSGVVRSPRRVGFLKQDFDFEAAETVGSLFGLANIEAAQRRLDLGRPEPEDLSAVADYWAKRAVAQEAIAHFGYSSLTLLDHVGTLSGGETTRLALMALLTAGPDYLLLDEPTNNLDGAARGQLIDTLRSQNAGALIVTHDRELLDQVDDIHVLTASGLMSYGRGYDAFVEKRREEEANALRSIDLAARDVARRRREAQEQRERAEQAAASGRARANRRGRSALEVGAAKEQAGRTQGRRAIVGVGKIAQANEQLASAKGRIVPRERLSFDLGRPLPSGSRIVVVEARDLGFRYPGSRLVFDNVNFVLGTGERLAVVGPNGSGKSTLLKLIAGLLKNYSGELVCSTKSVAYLDQRFGSVFDASDTVLSAFARHASGFSENKIRERLAQFLFRNVDALKPIEILSGGEKLRAAMAVVLGGKRPSEILLLDEPTNNLDLESIAYLEDVLTAFPGTIVAVSHDERFLANVGATRRLSLDK